LCSDTKQEFTVTNSIVAVPGANALVLVELYDPYPHFGLSGRTVLLSTRW